MTDILYSDASFPIVVGVSIITTNTLRFDPIVRPRSLTDESTFVCRQSIIVPWICIPVLTSFLHCHHLIVAFVALHPNQFLLLRFQHCYFFHQ